MSDGTLTEDLPAALRVMREVRGATIEEMAGEVGMAPSALWKLLEGRSSVDKCRYGTILRLREWLRGS